MQQHLVACFSSSTAERTPACLGHPVSSNAVATPAIPCLMLWQRAGALQQQQQSTSARQLIGLHMSLECSAAVVGQVDVGLVSYKEANVPPQHLH